MFGIVRIAFAFIVCQFYILNSEKETKKKYKIYIYMLSKRVIIKHLI